MIRSTIIATIQWTGIALLFLFMAPIVFEKTGSMHHLSLFLAQNKVWFYFFHGLIGLSIYCLFPAVVKLIARHQPTPPTEVQLQLAMKVRWYLVLIFIILNFLR